MLQIGASVATNWGNYYKLGQLLLQNRVAIANWGKMYNKLGQVLQIRAIIPNWGIRLICIVFCFVSLCKEANLLSMIYLSSHK